MKKYNAFITAKVDSQLKKEVTEILKSEGITISHAIRMLYNSIIYYRGIPPILLNELNKEGKDD